MNCLRMIGYLEVKLGQDGGKLVRTGQNLAGPFLVTGVRHTQRNSIQRQQRIRREQRTKPQVTFKVLKWLLTCLIEKSLYNPRFSQIFVKHE